jgi:hypothetical protein
MTAWTDAHPGALTRPLCKYFGSKWHASKHYPAPRHGMIVEPFAGSACYAAHYAARHVVLLDKDPDVVDLLDWLIGASPADVLALPVDLTPGEDIRTLRGVSRGGQLLIRNWQRVGRSTTWTVSKWNNMPGMWGPDTRAAVAENVQRIRHWHVVCAEYWQLPDFEATWFCDPPYQNVPPAYRRDIDCNTMHYGHLATWAQSRKGQVIVCEQEGADWLPFRPFRNLKAGTAGARGKSRPDVGVVWTNDASPSP